MSHGAGATSPAIVQPETLERSVQEAAPPFAAPNGEASAFTRRGDGTGWRSCLDCLSFDGMICIVSRPMPSSVRGRNTCPEFSLWQRLEPPGAWR